MKIENKVVYIHRRKDNHKAFYVGMGTPDRPRDFKTRSRSWFDIVSISGYTIEVVATNLSEKDAKELEEFIIAEYGIENLTNALKGSSVKSDIDLAEMSREAAKKRKRKKNLAIMNMYNEGFKRSEIAEQLNITLASVKKITRSLVI